MAGEETQSSGMSELGRLTGIFWEPRPVFEDLAIRPRWWTPIILLTVLAIVFLSAFSRKVGWDTFIQQQMERQAQSNDRLSQMSPEQRERAVAMSGTIAKYAGMGGAVLGMTIMVLVTAAVMLGIMNWLGGAGLNYKQALSVVSYSFLPMAISSILAFVVLMLKNPEDFDLQNPIPTNLGAFFSTQTTPKWLQGLTGSIDLFSIWVMLLMALGFSVAARRLPFGKALTLVLVPWALYVLLFKVALAGLQG